MGKPSVRFLDVQPYGDRFLITDPFGLSEALLASKELIILMSLMDGTRNDREIRAEFLRRTGIILKEEEYKEALKLLDENYLLLNDRFLAKLESLRREALSREVKEPFHAGDAYPEDSEKLKGFIDSSLKGEEKESVLGIIVPHMDMRVAIDTYGAVYGRLDVNPETVVILGVSHYIHETPFSACPLDLKTPLGVLRNDREVIDRLRSMFSYDIFHDILSYTKEHSIEFQSVFIKRLFPEAKVVPLIVSYGEEEFLKEIAQKIAKAIDDRETLIISSVDMSHVGKKFGDPSSYDPSPRDKEYISLLKDMKNEEAFRLLSSDNNRTRIDGQFTNFVFLELMRLMGASGGKEIDYRVYHEEPTDSKVSYAGMTFS